MLGIATGPCSAAVVRAGQGAVAPALPIVMLSAAQSQAEGNSGTRSWSYTITRSATAGPVTVPWAFSAGGTSASDFAGGAFPPGGTVSMADGQASATIAIATVGDALVESDETFTVSIAPPAGYALGTPSSATGTILNDDAPPAANANSVVQAGDSITDAADSYAALYRTAFPALTYHDHNNGGWMLSDLVADRPAVIARDAEVISVLIGANDLAGYAGGAGQYYADLIAYLAPIKTAGAKIVVCTPLPQKISYSASFNTARAALIPLLRAGHGVDFDELCDWVPSPMGADADAEDAVKYGDGLHPTTAGQAFLAPSYRGAMNRARGVARTPVFQGLANKGGQTAGATVVSDPFWLAGLAYGETVAISVTGGAYRINGGAWTTAGGVSGNARIELRGTANASAGGSSPVVFTAGGVGATFTITTASAVAFNPAAKNAAITLSNGNATAQGTNDAGRQGVRATAQASGSGTRSWTIAIDTIAAGIFSKFSMAFAEADAGFDTVPGAADANGVVIDFGTWGFEVYSRGAEQPGSSYAAIALTPGVSKARAEIDMASGDIRFMIAVDGVNFVQRGATVIAPPLTERFAHLVLNDASKVTADFGALT